MNSSIWLTLVSIAVGTYLIRVLPYIWMRRSLEKSEANGHVRAMPTWLTILGPTMIAAMFGTSLVPAQQDITSWIATAIGTLATYLVWRRTRSMGWPIFSGVLAFGLVIILV